MYRRILTGMIERGKTAAFLEAMRANIRHQDERGIRARTTVWGAMTGLTNSVVIASDFNTLEDLERFTDLATEDASFASVRKAVRSQMIYDAPHVRTRSTGSFGGGGPHPFATGAWRGPGSNTNIFARESHIDVMAARAGIDPVEFRLKNLADARMARVLKAAADAFRWTPAKAPSKRGFGVALLDYLNTYLAAMAEIAVDQTTGQIRVKRVTVAQDLGQVVNPQGAMMQMEGCVVMGLSSVLTEEIHFNGGDIRDENFDSYDITRFSQVPEIQTVLVDNPDLAPQGCGEPTITCMAALVANALFDAAGVRLFRLPLSPERVRQGLRSLTTPT